MGGRTGSSDEREDSPDCANRRHRRVGATFPGAGASVGDGDRWRAQDRNLAVGGEQIGLTSRNRVLRTIAAMHHQINQMVATPAARTLSAEMLSPCIVEKSISCATSAYVTVRTLRPRRSGPN